MATFLTSITFSTLKWEGVFAGMTQLWFCSSFLVNTTHGSKRIVALLLELLHLLALDLVKHHGAPATLFGLQQHPSALHC